MAGLTISGFVPETLEDIVARISSKLDAINPGMDLSPESPDGQLIGIMSYELSVAWNQLNQVYNSYNPALADGAALRNLGQLSGIQYGTANRSYATVELTGTTGVVVPENSIVSDGEYEYYTAYAVTIPSNAQVICSTPGPVPVPALTINTIVTPVTGWVEVAQSTEGVIGSLAMTDQEFRNLRTRTVMRNYTSTVDTMQARLLELGMEQAIVINNDQPVPVGGIPANTIAVSVGEIGLISDETIGTVILETNAAGCPTFGTTTVAIEDSQGYLHDVSFTKAAAVVIEIVLDVTFLSEESAGQEELIKKSLVDHVNALPAGDDVIWSRLFAEITPYGEAQVNILTVGRQGGAQSINNVVLTEAEYASMAATDITFTES